MAVADRPPVERALLRSSAIVVALLLAIGGLSLGGVAISKTATVAQCINDNLGDRNDPGQKDAAAHIAWAEAINKAVADASNPDPAVRAQGFAEIQTATAAYRDTLQADQAERDAHPLGKC